ncbi:aldose epimerase family protein [Actinacidiphila epipremni]|uniref:Aldose 1-epimerase n=1 Tax=Actinacidiphila epipremni TaxID=2053013 RepID=A0ABX1A3S0_9ACTN|nr:aldose epimerase family protein [Actinacidiphila epipremni]NJP48421.1 galactose mutarotase [Actinacidiphila epipremni]
MPTVTHSPAGTLPDGRLIRLWRLAAPGVTAEVLDLGASLHSLRCPDRTGRPDEVVVSPLDPADRLGAARYLGATIGRYANRIAGARLPTPDGLLPLDANERTHTLHGGTGGFDVRVWSAHPVAEGGAAGVVLRLVSPAGDQGFPGELHVSVTYSLSDAGELRIDYRATTDARTVVNLTNHTYWNLAGGTGATVLDHDLQVAADHYTRADAEMLPLPGPPEPVGGTPFDLTSPRRIGEALEVPDAQIRLAGGGFDHNWALGAAGSDVPARAAVLAHRPSGRLLECLTTQPGLQVYTGNHFDGSFLDRRGRPVRRHGGIALETQHFPDAPRRPDFPSTWLDPGEVHRSTTVYRFGVLP